MKMNEEECIIERGMHMIDKAIYVINRFVVNFFASLTITVKTPFIDFSFVPLMIKPKGF